MSAKPWHKRYHSDALQGMMPLTLEERGAYQTVLDLIYDRGGPIADNERLLAAYMNCSARKWRAIRDTLIAAGKLVAENGTLSNNRAEFELENDAKTTRKHAEHGAKGGRAKAEHAKNRNENNEGDLAGLKPGSGLRARADACVSRDQNTLPTGNGGEPPSLADRLWSDGLAVVVSFGIPEPKARGMLGKWRKLGGDAGVLALLAQAQQQAVSDLVPWMEAAVRSGGGRGPSGRRETEEERVARERAEFLERNYGADSPRAKLAAGAGT